jgi:5-formyltetrahydrofolate cyclo-ligase
MNSEQALRKQIEESITALRKTTAKATRSKKAAIKYLVELGLIEDEKPSKKVNKLTIPKTDIDLNKLISNLNQSQKEVLITFIKELINTKGNIARQSIEDYNLELNQAIKNVKKGNFTALEDLEKEMDSF